MNVIRCACFHKQFKFSCSSLNTCINLNMEEYTMEKLVKSEYEVQHFGFSAALMTYERKFLLRQLVLTLLDKAANKLTNKEEVLEELQQQNENVLELILADFKPDLDELQAMDERYFSIPPHVLLPIDCEHAKQYSEEDERHLNEQLEHLQQEFLNATLMTALLKAENADYEAIDAIVAEESQLHEQVEASFEAIDLSKLEKLVETTKNFVQKAEKQL